MVKEPCVTQRTKRRRADLPVVASESGANEKKSRTARWRAAALIILNLLMIAHFIQWRIMGTTLSPIEPSESMFTLQNGAVNAGFIFFAFALAATLIFGRFVCGWGCHILALQDLCGWILKKIGLKPRPFRSRLLVFVPLIVALYMFVWPTVGRYLSKPAEEPLFPQFTDHLITTDFWATFPPFWVAIPFLFICGFMTVYFLGQKGFCTYACPYGGFFSLADKVAPGRIRVTDACNECGECTAACTSNVIVHAEVKEYGMVVDPGCMKCMDCVSVCPNEALYFGFGKPAVAQKKSLERNYSLSWKEEAVGAAVFAASFFAAWDVYQLVPMLMALGIACVSTFLALRALRLATASNVTFYRWGLKISGSIKPAGWVFAAIALAWIGLNLHSGWVRYHERAGAMAFQNLQIPDELALAQADPAQWLSQKDKTNIAAGQKHFHDAVDLGLFVNKEAISKFAWIEFLAGNTDHAVSLLANAANYQTGQARALSLYYRGAILNRAGRYDEAIKDLDAAIGERDDLAAALEEKGVSLWKQGRKDEAIAAWRSARNANPNLPLANSFLAAATPPDENGSDNSYGRQAIRLVRSDPYFHWMLGLRLNELGFIERAEKHFAAAATLDPTFVLKKKK